MKHTKIARVAGSRSGVSIAVVMIAALCPLAAFSAQQPNKANQPAQPPVNDRFEYMSRELSLTADQKPKVKAIVDTQIGQWETLEKNKTLNGKQKIAMMQEINQSAQSKIEKILTADQRKKLQAIMDAGKPQPGKPSPNRKRKTPPGPVEP